ncbi:MAG: hypothetical protein SFU98_13330 [Leptospiraceae bacterium]|nr:hypothetical protein [Leptospiraceae bacterium]
MIYFEVIIFITSIFLFTNCSTKRKDNSLRNSLFLYFLGNQTNNTPSGYSNFSNSYLGYNLNTLLWEGGISDTNALKSLSDLKPNIIRYPGGTESDYFDWETGGTVNTCRFIQTSGGGCRTWDRLTLTERPFRTQTTYKDGKLEQFKILLNQSNSEALFVLNLITADYDTNLKMLEKAESLGIEVKYVEIGNEHYYAETNYETVFTNSNSYGLLAKSWISKLRTRFPKAKFAITGIVPEINLNNKTYYFSTDQEYITRATNWNSGLASSGAMNEADSVSLHVYARPNGNLTSTSFSATTVESVLNHADDYIDLYFTRPEFLAITKNKPLWFTEFNINAGEANGLVRSWTHGLYNILFLTRMLESEQVNMLICHMLMGNDTWQSIFHPGTFAGAVLVSGATPYNRTASGEALHLFNLAYNKSQYIRRLKLSDIGLSGQDERRVKAFKFRNSSSTDDSKLFLVNATASSIKLNLQTELSSNWTKITTYNSLPATNVLNSSSLTKATNVFSKEPIIPSYSIVLVE